MTDLSDILLGADYATAPFFAVLDGAQFENLPDALREGKFVAQSLYLDRGENNPEQVVTAPHLVLLDETARNPALRPPADTVPALLDLLGGRPAAVFWQCAKGEDALFRHLRGINMVLYPNEMLPEVEPPDDVDPDMPAGQPEPEEDAEGETHSLVLFRHADANVMAQVAPVLEEPQKARLLGPASMVLFPAEGARGGVQSVVSPAGVPAPPGVLTLSEPELMALDEANLALSRERIELHLRDVAPEYVKGMEAAELERLVQQSEVSGDALGINTEYGHGLWATLMLITGGGIAEDPQVTGHIASHPDGPDHAVEAILDELGASSDADWEAL